MAGSIQTPTDIERKDLESAAPGLYRIVGEERTLLRFYDMAVDVMRQDVQCQRLARVFDAAISSADAPIGDAYRRADGHIVFEAWVPKQI